MIEINEINSPKRAIKITVYKSVGFTEPALEFSHRISKSLESRKILKLVLRTCLREDTVQNKTSFV